MKVRIFENAIELGKASAKAASVIINDAIRAKGKARIVLSTGQSQFHFFDSLKLYDINWKKVEAFHLDEYVGISPDHKASFCKYIKERFDDVYKPYKVHYIRTQGDVMEVIEDLTEKVNSEDIDLGLIGIGENAHIAFNDPPADFDTREAFHIVTLNDECKEQQVREGWFNSKSEVFDKAVSMTCSQILKCKNIISVVPFKVKAAAIKKTLESEETNLIPATILKRHPSCTIMCDRDSASLLSEETIRKYL